MHLLLAPIALAAEITLTDIATLREAVAAAAPGDTFVLAAGTYTLDSTLALAAAGTAEAPITLRGEGATLYADTVEALKITGPHWHVEDLVIQGVCADDEDCEHALHIVGAADGTVVRGTTLVDFNAQIKANGESVGEVFVYPDDVVIEGNDLHDTRARLTDNPVTKLDVVGGRRWRVEANRISDFEKGGGDTVSYAAFLKGNSQDGVFERNLVVCSERFTGGVRVGLSFGGGGTSPDSICEDGSCTPEHQRGTMRNNLVAHCSDVGIYLNEAADSAVYANTLYATSGIDVRFAASTVALANNLLDGRIRERDDGTATLGTNRAEVDLTTVFAGPDALDFTLVQPDGIVDAGDTLPDLTDDFCGARRVGTPDAGAIEYDTFAARCDTTTVHPDADEPSGDTASDTGDGTGADSAGDTGGIDTGGGDTDESSDTGDDAETGRCGCDAPGHAGAGWMVLVAMVATRRRRAAASSPSRGHHRATTRTT